MALNLIDKYNTRVDSTDPEYPLGKAKNQEGGVVGTGTPVDKDWLNDDWGFKQAILKQANVTASGTPDNADSSQYLDAILAITSGFGDDVSKYGVVYGSGLSQELREANTLALQAAYDATDNLVYTGIVETYGSVELRNHSSHRGFSKHITGISGFHPTEPTLTDATIDRPDSQTNNLWSVTMNTMFVRSASTDCFYITPYQCKWEGCRFTAPLGNCFTIHDGGYQVENKWVDNYFDTFVKGIYAPGGFRYLTDAYTKDNYFYSGTAACETQIEITGASGGLFDGDHFYGSCSMEFVRLSQFINMRLTNAYFEAAPTSSRLYLGGGNPLSGSITNCSFWGGNGNTIDHRGDQSSLITLNLSDGVPTSLSFTGNTFEGGVNQVPVFNTLKGVSNSTSGYNIIFGKDNVLNGSYVKAVKGASGSATQTWFIESDHPQLEVESTTQNENYFNLDASYIIQGNTGFATSFPSLTANTQWLLNKELKIENRSTTTTLSFSTGGSTVIQGNPIVRPQTVAYISSPSTGIYYIRTLSDYSPDVELNKFSGVNFTWTGGSIPANGETRSLISLPSFSLQSTDVVSININNCPDGVTASAFYDNTVDNVWKAKLVNSTGTAIPLSSSLGNVSVIR